MTSFFFGGGILREEVGCVCPHERSGCSPMWPGGGTRLWHEIFPPVSTPKHPSLFISQELGEQQTVG